MPLSRRSLLVSLAVAASTGARAQWQPTKPIRFVVPFPPGGAVDGVSRVLAQSLSQQLGQQVLVDNRPGADGAIAASFVAAAPPDGTTLLLATNTALNAVPAMRKQPPYDPIADFTAIGLVGRIGVYVFVNNDVPATTLAEFVQYARSRPGALNYGTGHATSILATAQLMSLANLKMTHVPYKGDAQVMGDLLPGRLQLSIASPVPGLGLAKEGKVRVLATLLGKRSPSLPDVPTMAEAGFPEYSLVAWAGIFGPARMARDVTDRLSRELVVSLRKPELIEALERQQFEPQASTQDEAAAFLKKQVDIWQRAVREAGIEKE